MASNDTPPAPSTPNCETILQVAGIIDKRADIEKDVRALLKDYQRNKDWYVNRGAAESNLAITISERVLSILEWHEILRKLKERWSKDNAMRDVLSSAEREVIELFRALKRDLKNQLDEKSWSCIVKRVEASPEAGTTGIFGS